MGIFFPFVRNKLIARGVSFGVRLLEALVRYVTTIIGLGQEPLAQSLAFTLKSLLVNRNSVAVRDESDVKMDSGGARTLVRGP